MPKSYNAPPGFEMNPAGMADECQALRRWRSTHAPRLAALEALYATAQLDAGAGREAAATLASERATNALLTAEVEQLRAAALEVIEFNRQHARDKYGNADKAES